MNEKYLNVMYKLNKSLTFIILVTAPFITLSQDYWEIIDVPDSIKITCIATNSQHQVYLGTTGGVGGIYRSVDNCSSWEYLGFQNSGIEFIELNSSNHLFTSFSGCIYNSFNSGISWDTIYCNTGTVNVKCLKTYDENLIFAGLSLNISGIIRSENGGVDWEEVFILPSNAEFFYEFVILNEDTIYACTTHWFDGGGVYRSVDGGDNWEHIGMYDFHCISLEKNSNGDIFVGTYGHNTQYWLSGVYVLYNGVNEWVQLYTALVNDMIINSDDDIYVATDNGVLVSTDNGQTFEYINEGLFEGDVDNLAIDSAGYLYASSYNPCDMAKSFEPTITDINNPTKINTGISINHYPNPVSGTITFYISTETGNYPNVEIWIFNTQGQLVEGMCTVISPTGKTKFSYNADPLPAGIYYYHTIINKQKFSNKFIKN